MTRSPPIVFAAALSLALLGNVSWAASVRMSAAVQRGLGIVSQRLTVARRAGEVDAFAKVLDPEPLVQLNSDLETAVAAAVASRAEAERSQALHAGGAPSPRRTWKPPSHRRVRTLSRWTCCAIGSTWNGDLESPG